MVLIMGTMSFIRKKSRRTKKGEVLNYYYLVENRWVNGKVRQKIIKYLGTSPNTREIPLDPSLAGPLAQAIMSGTASVDQIKEILQQLGIPITGRVKQVSLTFNPPLQKLSLRVE